MSLQNLKSPLATNGTMLQHERTEVKVRLQERFDCAGGRGSEGPGRVKPVRSEFKDLVSPESNLKLPQL
jgi:hypothetical protein